MRILLLLLLLSVGASALKRIVHRIVEGKTWHEAEAYCRQHHTDLLTIRNQAENDEITDEGWIGLRYKPTTNILTWKWKWSDGHDDNFCTWAYEEPDFGQNCGLKVAGDPALHSHYCNSKKPFYCVHELILVEEQKSWEEALEYCRHLTQHHPVYTHRYRLAFPLTNVYSEDVFHGGFKKVWVWLRYLGDQWLWLDGQGSNDHLANCPPIHRCGTLEKNVTTNIVNRRCDEELFFLCQKI